MNRVLFFLLLILSSFFFSNLYAQDSKIQIKGSVKEQETNDYVEFATIQLLNALDSVPILGTSTNKSGEFTINANKAKSYILKASFVGFQDTYKSISGENNINVGTLFLTENSVLLKEAVVEAKAIEIAVKGDTIEYNADSYKVQENAALEELIKKIPGAEVDSDGKITINGKEIKKILVDGKEFFSDDPKVASKNLPAKMVEKLQVLDKKSDLAQLTGFDDGDETPVINLQTKPGMKKSVFGNAFIGAGNHGKYEGNGFLAIAGNNTNITLTGGANNTNNAGFSDLAGAMFSGGGGRGINFGGGRGITKTSSVGINVAHEIKDKLKLSVNARYMDSDNNVISSSDKVYTSNVNPGSETSNSRGDNKSKSFASGMRLEWTPDKMTTIIFSPNIEYNTTDRKSTSNSETSYEEISALYSKNNFTSQQYNSKGHGNKLSANLDISRKLNDKGRVITLGLRGGRNKSTSDGYNFNEIKYLNIDNDSIIDQRFDEFTSSNTWSVTTSYVEPFVNRYFMEFSYRVSGNDQETDKKTFINANLKDPELAPDYTLLDTLNTRYVKNNFINQNISLKIRKTAEKYNWMAGVALDPSHTSTKLRDPSNPNIEIPTRNFMNFTPVAQFNYLPNKTTNLRINYTARTSEPSSLMLYDGIYSRNGLNTTSGNPNLKPSFNSNLNIRFRTSNPQKGSFMAAFVTLTSTKNAIVSTSSVNPNTGGKDSSYENVSGNKGGNGRFIFNMPLKAKSWSVSSMSFLSYNLDHTFIDKDKNETKILRAQENIGIQFRSDVIDFALRGNASYNNMKNSITTTNNNNTWTYGGLFDFTFYAGDLIHKSGAPLFCKGWNIDSDINYSANAGYSNSFKLNQWLWNASMTKDLFNGKYGTGSIRFKIYDILKQKSNISQNYTSTYREESRTNTIGQYFMIHFVYKFQKFAGGIKGSDMEPERRRGPGGGPGRRHPGA